MLQRFLLLWLILLSAVAYWWPDLTGSIDVGDPFFATRDWGILSPIFGVAMFCIGCLLPPDELQQLRKRWDSVLAGTAIQYTVMPLSAYGAAMLFQLDDASTIGLVLVGCVPGAMASNVLTLAARGNVSYSVSLTTSATLLSPLVVPFALTLFLGQRVPVDAMSIFLSLLATVVGPVLAGYMMCRLVPGFGAQMQSVAPVVANLVILWIIATVVGLNRTRLADVPSLVLVALLLVNLIGYAAGYAGGRVLRLPEGMRRALTLEVGMQNAGLGSLIAVTYFAATRTAAIPTAAYTFGCMLTGTILANIWGYLSRSRRPK